MRLAQAGQEERREGERFARLPFVLANGFAGVGDIELHQPVHGMLLQSHPSAIDHQQPGSGIGQDTYATSWFVFIDMTSSRHRAGVRPKYRWMICYGVADAVLGANGRATRPGALLHTGIGNRHA